MVFVAVPRPSLVNWDFFLSSCSVHRPDFTFTLYVTRACSLGIRLISGSLKYPHWIHALNTVVVLLQP